MRIGLFIERRHDGTRGSQQVFSMVESLARPGATRHEVVVFTPHEDTRMRLHAAGVEAFIYGTRGVRVLDRWSSTAVGGPVLRRLRRIGLTRLGRHLDAFLDDHAVDVAVFTECGEAALRTGDHPFVVTVWHAFNGDVPEFPEVYRDRRFQQRERAPRATLTRALAVVVDSPDGARRVAGLYRVDPERIVVIAFDYAERLAPLLDEYASVRRRWAWPER